MSFRFVRHMEESRYRYKPREVALICTMGKKLKKYLKILYNCINCLIIYH
jgi:hypothetical protein